MSDSKSRRRSSQRSSRRRQDFAADILNDNSASPRSLFETASDACFWITFVGVAIGFGGRAAIGQLVMVLGATATMACWLLHEITSSKPRYRWSGSEWLWCAGIVVGLTQIVPLPGDWLLFLSPRMSEILPMWFAKDRASLFANSWTRLSLAPSETESGLATFIAYALLFVVLFQRLKTVRDVEQMMSRVAIVVILMMVFAQAQYWASNGSFFWLIRHPFVATDAVPTGSFTNRNHLSQFLAMGIGPLICLILRRMQQQDSGEETSSRLPRELHLATLLFWFVGLSGTVLTILMTWSRGGLLAVTCGLFVSVGMMCRLGLLSIKLFGGLVLASAAVGIVFYFNGYEALSARLESNNTGRTEIWQANVAVAQDFKVLGTGVGTHADAHWLQLDVAESFNGEFTHAESGYLQVASETGLTGVALAFLFIGVATRWCWLAFGNSDPRVQAQAVAVSASLAVNLIHAIGDFFWYTPSCMLLLAIQLAGVCRLQRPTFDTDDASNSPSTPRGLFLLTGCGLAAASVWMFDQKWSPAIAEPDRMQYLAAKVSALKNQLGEEDRLAMLRVKIKSALSAAKLDPRNSRLQEEAAAACLELFNLRQEKSENPLAFAQIRDAVKASEFESQQALRDWLKIAVGSNQKLLYTARTFLKRALASSPLRSHSYIMLAELNFLEPAGADFEKQSFDQALRLRPKDPDTLFSVGRNMMLSGDLDGALVHWKEAFHRSLRLRNQMTELLTAQVDPDFFLNKLDADWQSLGFVVTAYEKSGRTDDAQTVRRIFIERGLQKLKQPLSNEEIESILTPLNEAYLAQADAERAIRLLMKFEKRMPDNFRIRYLLGSDLYNQHRIVEAAEFLEWCASREPEDRWLQQVASESITARLKNPAAARSQRVAQQVGLEE